MNKENIKKLNDDNDNDVIDIRGAINKAVFHWPLYLFVLLISLAAANLYFRYTKPVFSSTAKIYIKDNKSNEGGLSGLTMFSDGKVVDNEIEVIKSPLILEDVIRNNRFNVFYYLKGKVVNKDLYQFSPFEISFLTDSSKVGNHSFDVELVNDQQIKVTYPSGGSKEDSKSVLVHFNQPFSIGKDLFSVSYNPALNRNNDKEFQVRLDSITTLAYTKSDEIRTGVVTRNGSVVELSYEDENPKRAAAFLNAVLTAYNEYTLSEKNKITLNTIRFIEGRLASLGDELNVLERDVENFKKSRGITEIGESARLILDQARDADQRLSQSKIQLLVYDDVEKHINNPNTTKPFAPIYGGVDGPLNGFINRYEDAVRERARLSLSVQPGHPLLEDVENEIANTRKTIKSYITGLRRNAGTERAGIQQRVNKVEGMISKVPTQEREFINIQRQQSVKEGLYNFLLQRKEESSVAYASNIVENKVISPAYIPAGPIKPKKAMMLTIFVFGGLVLTTIYIRLKYLINNKLTSKKEIEKIAHLPVIAEIYKQEDNLKKVSLSERSVLTEQILNLRNNLKFLLTGLNHSPVILFTSSISGEGKTFISSHLGNALTYNDKKAILLELDLRKPKLAQSLGISNASGITNYLIGVERLEQVIKKVPGNNNLFIIPSGPIPPNPIELIEGEKMRDLFVLLRQQYDYIIIDTSPVGLVSDAKSLSPYIDCSLFVARFNYTPVAKFKELAADLNSDVFHNRAIIFNGVDIDSSYGYYSYGYSNYGYGYGTTRPKKRFLSSFLKGLRQRMF